MNYLILTEPDDEHAMLVKLALEAMGQHVRLLFTADHPTKQKNSIFISNSHYRWRSIEPKHAFEQNEYDVVWWRRIKKPFLNKGQTHPSDYAFIRRENNLFFDSLTDNLAPHAWWVNPKHAALRANSKLLQMKVASECGMIIPETLCSNNPQDIQLFLSKHEKDGVIYKPLCAHIWFDEKAPKTAYTSKLHLSDLPSNHSLQLTPGIYQKEIHKQYELRVTCFGQHLVAAKLDSQAHVDGKIDWRAIPVGKLSVEPYQLPYGLSMQIRYFMQKMGLVFGCLDFIVSNDNHYVFLEVNEQGQFLWLEDYNPEFKMLHLFANFLIQRTLDYQGFSSSPVHTIAKYSKELEEKIAENRQNHLDVNHLYISQLRNKAC